MKERETEKKEREEERKSERNKCASYFLKKNRGEGGLKELLHR